MSVASGSAALQFLRNCAVLPKVILLDTQLSDMCGFELLQRIRSDERTKSLPVFLLFDPTDRVRKAPVPYLMINGYIPRTADTQILAERLTIFRHLVGQHREGVNNVEP